MNADLEEQLRELGPEYRTVVDRLRAARTVEPAVKKGKGQGEKKGKGQGEKKGKGQGERSRWRAAWLVAASLLVAVGLTVHFQTIKQSSRQTLPTYGAREYHQSLDEMIASQRADGSWQNDFLTRRNARALAASDSPRARIAYKKAMRNLRTRGIL